MSLTTTKEASAAAAATTTVGKNGKRKIYHIHLVVVVLVLALLKLCGQSTRLSAVHPQKAAAGHAGAIRSSHSTSINHMTSSERSENQSSSSFQVLPDDPEYTIKQLYQPYVLVPYKLVFFFVPKNGCTMWKMLFSRMMGANKTSRRDVHNMAINGISQLGEFSLEQATSFMTRPDWTRAMFVRDPMERWLSAYLDKIVHDQLCRGCCRRHLGRNISETQLSDCCKAMEKSPLFALRIMNASCPDRHWIPQSERLQPKYQAQINFWGHHETLQRDSEALLRRLGAWEQYGATGWGKRGQSRLFDTSNQDGRVHATHANDRMAQYMTPALKKHLQEYYADDYDNAFFGLTRPAGSNTD